LLPDFLRHFVVAPVVPVVVVVVFDVVVVVVIVRCLLLLGRAYARCFAHLLSF